jgi:DNA-binding NtrC family response regulator
MSQVFADAFRHGMEVAVQLSIMISNEATYSQNSLRTVEPPSAAPLGIVRDELAPISLDERLRTFEASLITWALTACRGNKSKAARLLQIKRSTLGDRIHRCGLDGVAAGVPAEERR